MGLSCALKANNIELIQSKKKDIFRSSGPSWELLF